MHRQADNATNKCVGGVVFDIPLLVESKSWRGFLDYILVVDCTVETQIARVKVRNALTEAAVRDILEVQVGRVTRLGAADLVIFNDNCSLEQLANQVQAISTKIGL
jgi:dephospho-CoA kinase